jgi:hypothetical protein
MRSHLADVFASRLNVLIEMICLENRKLKAEATYEVANLFAHCALPPATSPIRLAGNKAKKHTDLVRSVSSLQFWNEICGIRNLSFPIFLDLVWTLCPRRRGP